MSNPTKYSPIKVTDKQEKFCKEYVKTNSHIEASKKAYPNQSFPVVQGIENLSKPNVIQRIQENKKKYKNNY